MTPAQTALNTKRSNESLLKQVFKGGARVAGKGRYTVSLGKSNTGPCKICRANAGRHNIGSNGQVVPLHPNCKCSIK